MDCLTLAHDALNAIPTRGMTADQALARAQILALLPISHELSSIHHLGINPDFTDGELAP